MDRHQRDIGSGCARDMLPAALSFSGDADRFAVNRDRVSSGWRVLEADAEVAVEVDLASSQAPVPRRKRARECARDMLPAALSFSGDADRFAVNRDRVSLHEHLANGGRRHLRERRRECWPLLLYFGARSNAFQCAPTGRFVPAM
jgi:phosphomannomutase